MFVVQMRHKGKTYEIWDETVPLPTFKDAEIHIETDRSDVEDDRYQYRIVEVKKDFF